MLIVLGITCGYVTMFFLSGSLLHWAYHRRKSAAAEWKHQPAKFQTAGMIKEKLPLVLVNAFLINTMIGLGIERTLAGRTAAYWNPLERGIPYLLLSTVGLFFFYHFVLFYFHKAMHRPALFRRFHHLHHRFKAPMFLDALYEHPLEAFYGGIVMSAPLYLFPVNMFGYLFFLSMVGAHELFDHSGINLNIPFLSRSSNHDEHHLRSNCYYGQLLSILDRLHGTVRGVAGAPLRKSSRQTSLPSAAESESEREAA